MQTFSTIGLLLLSNIFMTFAWYGHLKYKFLPLWQVIVISWLIAFFEYCLQVPANRIGSSVLSAFQLKIIQEILTIIVFVIFARFYLGENLGWNHAVAFALIIGAVALVFK